MNQVLKVAGPLGHGLGDVVPYQAQRLVGPELGQPGRYAAYVTVVNRQSDPVRVLHTLVPVEHRLNEVITQKPRAPNDQQVLPRHLTKFILNRFTNFTKIIPRDVVGFYHGRPAFLSGVKPGRTQSVRPAVYRRAYPVGLPRLRS